MNALVAALCLLVAPTRDSTLLITFFDVGQGDAVLIESPEGKVVLVDGGRDRDDVAAALRDLEIEMLDLVIASHGHADHVGGLAAVLRAFDVAAFLDNGMASSTDAYRDLMDAVEESRAQYLAPSARRIEVGSVALRIIPPDPAAPQDAQNRASVGVVIEFGAFRAFLGGDADPDALRHFLQRGMPVVDVLKASHHGARNGVTPGWLDATKPRLVVISVGAGNSYGHPDPWALRYYGAVAEEVLRTDEVGDVVVEAWPDGSFVVIDGEGTVLAEFAPRGGR